MPKSKFTEETVQGPGSNHKRMSSFYAWDGDTLILNILGTPGSKRNAIGKVKGNQLKVYVTEAPQAGRATLYMVQFIAKQFEVSKNDIEVVFGRSSVNKQLRIKNPKNLPAEIIRTEDVYKK